MPLKTFDQLVTFVTWMIIEGITTGEPLRVVVYRALSLARQWDPDKE